MSFLGIVVIVMAVALAAEIFALAGMALMALRLARRTLAVKEELQEKFHPSIRLIKELRISLMPDAEVLRKDSKEIATVLVRRFSALRAAYQDVRTRAERIRLRMQSDGVESVHKLQRSKRVIHRGIVVPIRTVSRIVGGVSATAWLLRKVA